MVFQIALSCESSLLFSSVLGSRGTPKASKTRLGGAFFSLCGPGGPQEASKVNFCSILGAFGGLLLGAFGAHFRHWGCFGCFLGAFFHALGGSLFGGRLQEPKINKKSSIFKVADVAKV